MTNETSPAILGLRTLAVAISLALAGCADLPPAALAGPSTAAEPIALRAEPFVPGPGIEPVSIPPDADEVRVVREADGTAFAIFPGGDVLKLHGPPPSPDVILGPLVSPADVANAAAAASAAAPDACVPPDDRCPASSGELCR